MNQPLKVDMSAPQAAKVNGPVAVGDALPPLDGTDLIARLGGLRVVTFDHRDVIYRECRGACSIHLVISGLVKLVTHVTDERTRIVRLLSAGDFLGLDGLFEEAHRQTAVALGQVTMYRIPVTLLRGVKSRDPAFYCRLLECWYVHLAYADTWITQFSTGPIRPRVARLLKFLSEREPNAGPPRVRLLTCEEVAEVLGVTPESVSRSLAEFKREGLLRRASRSDPDQFFCDLQRLDDIAQGGG
jgi:CRP-like cAMP-binding protein